MVYFVLLTTEDTLVFQDVQTIPPGKVNILYLFGGPS